MSIKKLDAIVIGAGFAGLTVARKLQDEGLKVLLLEARERVGGRAHTSFVQHQGITFPLEYGAQWIHGDVGNPITKLAQQHGACLIPCPYGSQTTALYKAPGQLLTWWDYCKAGLGVALFFLDLYLARWFSPTDISIATLANRTINRYRLSGITARAVHLTASTAAAFDATDAAAASVLQPLDHFPGEDVVLRQGYQHLYNALAQGLDVRLQCAVQEVRYDSCDGVRVVSVGEEMAAGYLVCTVPVGVLKAGAIKFTPPLPPLKQSAISHIGVGLLHKSYLLFDTVFWEEDTTAITRLPQVGEDIRWPYFINLYRLYGVAGLVALNTGEYAWELEKMTQQQVMDDATAALRAIYGPKADPPVQVITSDWGRDPFSRGAYTYYSVGLTPQKFHDLKAPLEGRVFFAGEGVNGQHNGYTHGALMSGEQAAQELLQYHKRAG